MKKKRTISEKLAMILAGCYHRRRHTSQSLKIFDSNIPFPLRFKCQFRKSTYFCFEFYVRIFTQSTSTISKNVNRQTASRSQKVFTKTFFSCPAEYYRRKLTIQFVHFDIYHNAKSARMSRQ